MENFNRLWINTVKVVAILLVITAHVQGTLYNRDSVQILTYSNVPLFILVMGITTYWSYSKANGRLLDKVVKRSAGILVPYAVATACYDLFYARSLDFACYVSTLINFSGAIPLYYVQMYMQLLIISPILFYAVHNIKGKSFFEQIILNILLFAFIVLLSISSIKYTNILDIYGGAGNLFAGSFLILLYIGMLIGAYYEKIDNIKLLGQIILSGVFLAGTIFMWKQMIEYGFEWSAVQMWGNGENPPGIEVMLYSLCMLFTIYFATKLFYRINGVGNIWIQKVINFGGQHTLYVFLYHILFLDLMKKHDFLQINIVIKVIIYYAIMIGASLVVETICVKMKKFVLNGYGLLEKV